MSFSRIAVCLAAAILSIAGFATAETSEPLSTVVLDCAANQGISSIGIPNQFEPKKYQDLDERNMTFGGTETFPLRQTQNWGGFEQKCVLFNFDMAQVKGWTVTEAYLDIAVQRWDIYGAGLCSVFSDWSESNASGVLETGALCWNWKRKPAFDNDTAHWLAWQSETDAAKRPSADNWWAFPGSKFYSVAWMHPACIYSHAGPRDLIKYADKAGQRRIKIPVSPRLIHAMAAGISNGFVLTDDKGQVAEALMLDALKVERFAYTPEFDIQIYSRFASESLRPKLIITGKKADTTPPGAIMDLRVEENKPSGEVVLAWTAPGDDGDSGGAVLTYDCTIGLDRKALPLVQYMKPRPVEPGAVQRLSLTLIPGRNYTIFVRAYDEAGNASEPATIDVTTVASKPVDLKAVTPSRDLPTKPLKDLQLTNFTGLFFIWASSDLVSIPADAAAKGLDKSLPPNSDAEPYFRNSVWDTEQKTVSLSGIKNEVLGFQLHFTSYPVSDITPQITNIRIHVSDLKQKDGNGVLSAAKHIKRYREWYVYREPETQKDGTIIPGAWLPEVCVPVGGAFPDTFSIPDLSNFPDKKTQVSNQSFFIDAYIPKDAPTGVWNATITVSADGLDMPVELNLVINVADMELPDTFSWPVEMNCYTWVAGPYGNAHIRSDSQRCIEIERRYYQLAHEHRCTLNIVPYSQSGVSYVATLPHLTGSDDALRYDERGSKDYDGRYGPLLDGRVFSEAYGYYGPGMNMPISQFYLPFNENWPVPIASHYADDRVLKTRPDLAEWAKTSRIEDAFSVAYKQSTINVVSELMKHFSAQKWNKTRFQFFLNNKYYFKVPMFSETAGSGNGTSFWLLDEPVDYDDFEANRFFMQLYREGVALSGVKDVNVDYRVDISNPWMNRGVIDNIDLWNSSFLAMCFPTVLFTQRYLPERRWWSYGGGHRVGGDPLDTVRAFMRRYTWGTVGDLPQWNTTGNASSWTSPTDTALFYPGNSFPGKLGAYDGPVPSLRMKLWRRAQQDIEYLLLLERETGASRSAVADALAVWSGEGGRIRGSATFETLTPKRLNELRTSIAKGIADAGKVKNARKE
ncbi:MAG: hypothetical protein ABIH86_02745 [Planctomycetota bacterium]